jgi:hypothetical protein
MDSTIPQVFDHVLKQAFDALCGVRLDATNAGIQSMEGAEAVGSTLDGFELSNVELREVDRLGFVSPDA